MALKSFNPVTPSTRQLVLVDRTGLWKGRPEKSLVAGQTKTGGRNNHGRITSRRHGGGHKQLYRTIDFIRSKFDVGATVERIEYDPNRTCHIALLKYDDGVLSYIIAPQKVAIRDRFLSGLYVGRDGGRALLKLSSGEVRLVSLECRATIGAVSNPDQKNINLGKAGRSRWLGRRPSVRGIAMNPVDHPHGGRTNGGRHPVTPWGLHTKGKKTRTNKSTSKWIVTRRKKK